MNGFDIIVLISILGVIGLGAYNIRSLIMKWQNNKSAWEDLLVGIVMWGLGIAALIWIFFQQLAQ